MFPEEMLQDQRFVRVLDGLPCKPHQNGWHDICPACLQAVENLVEIHKDLEEANDKLGSKYGVLSSVELSIEHLYGVDEPVTRYFRKTRWDQAHLFDDGSKAICPKCGSTDIRLFPDEPQRAACSDCLEGPSALAHFHKKETEIPSAPLEPQDEGEELPF